MDGRWKFGGVALCALALLLAVPAVTQVATPTILLSDDFEDGIVDTSLYIPVGNAVITESGGRMHIQTFGPGDGVEVVIPSNTACFHIDTEIPEAEFDELESFGVAAYYTDSDGNEDLLVSAELLRPFWNRCQVTWHFGDKSQAQTEGIWG